MPCRDRFNAIQIDRMRVKPIVKITGEFWAQTTEGDGNFNMFKFLEKEGAQVMVEPIGTWIMYMIHQAMQKSKDQRGLDLVETNVSKWNLEAAVRQPLEHAAALAKLTWRKESSSANITLDRCFGRHCPSPDRSVRTATPRPSVL